MVNAVTTTKIRGRSYEASEDGMPVWGRGSLLKEGTCEWGHRRRGKDPREGLGEEVLGGGGMGKQAQRPGSGPELVGCEDPLMWLKEVRAGEWRRCV